MLVLLALSIVAIYLFGKKWWMMRKAGTIDRNFMNDIHDFIHEGKIKAETERIKELVLENPETVLEDYEQKIVDGLHNVDAKTVQVEFLYDGKAATGKVNRDTILRMLSQNDYFSSFNFTTVKSGEKIISELGAGTWRADNPLTCKHIVKITYGKKVLYQNQKNETL